MGLSQFPAPTLTAVAATYGASAIPSHSVSASTTYVSAASVTFTTTGTTSWLFEVDADINWSTTSASLGIAVGARVDGGDYGLGGLGLTYLNATGYTFNEFQPRGRYVLTLSAGSHTAAAALYNRVGTLAVNVNTITITATQLAG